MEQEQRTIVIGDVHGCAADLDRLLAKLQYDQSNDSLGFVGDLVDRGPDSKGVVDRVRKYAAWRVLGNHDEKHWRYRRAALREKAGGKRNPVQLNPERTAEHWLLTDAEAEFLGTAPLTWRFTHNGQTWVAVHAGFEIGTYPEANHPNVCIRMRYVGQDGKMASTKESDLGAPVGTVSWGQRWYGPEKVVYGHAVYSLTDPTIDEFAVGIDTGCCFGGRLTAMVFEPGRDFYFVQVQAEAKYAEWYMKGKTPPYVSDLADKESADKNG